MNILDYIVLILAAGCVVFGVFKGIIKQVLTIIGIIFVATLTATVAPYVQSWFANTSLDENSRTVVAMIATVVLLAAVYAVAAVLLQKLFKKHDIVKIVDSLLGAVLGFAVVYLTFAVIFALFNNTPDDFMPLLKSWAGSTFRDSWMAQHIYRKNPFGNWVVVDIAQKLLDKLNPPA